MVDVWSGQSWVAGMYIVGRWPKKMAGEARDKGFTAAHYCVWISRPSRLAAARGLRATLKHGCAGVVLAH
jgi:hypothetical protein